MGARFWASVAGGVAVFGIWAGAPASAALGAAGVVAAAVPSQHDLHSVSCTGSKNCVAVGVNAAADHENGAVLAETWHGTRWTVDVMKPPSGSLGSTLSSVSCVSANNCVAVGYYFYDLPDHNTRNVAFAEFWNGAALEARQARPARPCQRRSAGGLVRVGEELRSGRRDVRAREAVRVRRDLERRGVEDDQGAGACGHDLQPDGRLVHLAEVLHRGGRLQPARAGAVLERPGLEDREGSRAGQRRAVPQRGDLPDGEVLRRHRHALPEPEAFQRDCSFLGTAARGRARQSRRRVRATRTWPRSRVPPPGAVSRLASITSVPTSTAASSTQPRGTAGRGSSSGFRRRQAPGAARAHH